MMRRRSGFTYLELVIVMVVMGIITAIATPFFLQWRHDLNARQGAREAYDLLRQARSKALSTSKQHMVSFQPDSRKFRMVKGSRGYNTPADQWGNAEWATLPSGVALKRGSDGSSATVDVQFNADGTARLQTPAGTDLVPPASTVSLCVQGGSGRENIILISTCGRITFQ